MAVERGNTINGVTVVFRIALFVGSASVPDYWVSTAQGRGRATSTE